MIPARLAGAVLAALAVAGAAAADDPRGWDAALPPGSAVEVVAEPVDVAGELTGLAPAGAWALRSDHPDFGGLSGLLVRDGRLYAVTDQGRWFGAALVEGQGGSLRLDNTRIAPMRTPGGGTWGKAGGDAEGLAWLGSRLAVSFERDHRIMLLRDSGRLGATIQPRAFEQFPSNKGLEALAILPDGRLIALSESTDADGVAVFVVAPDGTAPDATVTESRLPPLGRHHVTGADVGPDGHLYLVLRHFSPLIGVSIRVTRYALDPDGLPAPESAETLAAFEQHDGIDNMEGIALERAPDGGLRLWLIADDNFNVPLQRTLLLRLEVTG